MRARRIAGFGSPGAIMAIAAAVLLLVVVTHTLDAELPAPAPQAPVPGAGIAYAPFVVQDSDTGCQYLSTHTSTGLAPRIAADGKTHMGCREVDHGKS